MSRWLAIYATDVGVPRAAMIKPGSADGTVFPFGIDAFGLGLADYSGKPLVLVEMPDDENFRPTVVDTFDDEELPLQFIDL